MNSNNFKTVGVALLADPSFCESVDALTAKIRDSVQNELPVDALPKHVSLRQSFPFKGDQKALEEFFLAFFKAVSALEIKTKKIQVLLTEGGRNALVWVRAKENLRLRLLHYKLLFRCKKRFGIPAVGFDGLRWVFHSTILYQATDAQTARELKKQYHNLPFKTIIRPTSGVLFYCAGNADNPTEYCVGKTYPIRQVSERSR